MEVSVQCISDRAIWPVPMLDGGELLHTLAQVLGCHNLSTLSHAISIVRPTYSYLG